MFMFSASDTQIVRNTQNALVAALELYAIMCNLWCIFLSFLDGFENVQLSIGRVFGVAQFVFVFSLIYKKSNSIVTLLCHRELIQLELRLNRFRGLHYES